jgi:hypothetical protein
MLISGAAKKYRAGRRISAAPDRITFDINTIQVHADAIKSTLPPKQLFPI